MWLEDFHFSLIIFDNNYNLAEDAVWPGAAAEEEDRGDEEEEGGYRHPEELERVQELRGAVRGGAAVQGVPVLDILKSGHTPILRTQPGPSKNIG